MTRTLTIGRETREVEVVEIASPYGPAFETVEKVGLYQKRSGCKLWQGKVSWTTQRTGLAVYTQKNFLNDICRLVAWNDEVSENGRSQHNTRSQK